MFTQAASAAMPDQAVPIELTLQSGQSSPPSIFPPIWNSTYDWPASSGYNTWTANKQTTFPQGYQLNHGLSGQPGLWVWPIGSPAAGDKYPPGYAEYYFRAPGTTRIARASVDVTFRPALYNHHCTDIGLRSDVAVRMNFRDCSPPTPNSTTTDTWGPIHSRNIALFDPLATPTAKEAFVRLEKPVCNGANGPACLKYIPANDAAAGGSYLRAKKIAMTLVDDDLPVVTPSEAFYALDDTYIDGKQVYPLTVASSDAGAGIFASQFEHTLPTPPATTETLHEKMAMCDPAHDSTTNGSRICPAADSFSLSVDTNPFPEGTNIFHTWAVDPARNVGDKTWTVKVDRTPPPAPPNMRFLTPDEGSGQVEWDESVDPVLADGTPGSGTKNYRYRSQINGGTWTDWAEIATPRQITNEVYDQPIGTVVGFEVVAVDLVGNVSEMTTASGVVTGNEPALLLGGQLAQFEDDYVNGLTPLTLDLTATDPETGIRSMQATRAGSPLAQYAGDCVDGAEPLAPGKQHCASQLTRSALVDVLGWPEGRQVVGVQAEDRAHNTTSDEVSFYIDRTAPPAPTDLDLELETESMTGTATWTSPEDPALQDGNPGSGVDHTEYRFARPGSGFTGWQASSDDMFVIEGVSEGEVVNVELRSIDAAGNSSSVTQQNLVADHELPHSGRLRVCAKDARLDGGTSIQPIGSVRIRAYRYATGKSYSLYTSLDSAVAEGCTQVRLPEGNYAIQAWRTPLDPMPVRAPQQHPNTVTTQGGLAWLQINIPNSSGVNDYEIANAGFYAGWDGWDCANGSPCGRFDAVAAAEYASRWGEERNPPGYEYIAGGAECTNFISQALRTGGLRFGQEFDNRDPSTLGDSTGIDNIGPNDNQAWWYLKNGGLNNSVDNQDASSNPKMTASWVSAEALIWHLKHRGLVREVGSPLTAKNVARARAHRGDVFAFNFLNYGNTVDHLAIVSGIDGNGRPLMSSHDTDRADHPWERIVNDATGAHGAYGSGWVVHRYRIRGARF